MKYSGFDTLKEALDAHKQWTADNTQGKRANLSEANLRWANLREADLRWADLSGADLSEANLREADLRWADLSGADLSEANLSEANLSGANLRWANLRAANLRGAGLSGADLRAASLRGIDLSGAYLRAADLSGANLPNGCSWESYLSELVPALCTAGGKTLEEVAAAWDCHSWENCPMYVAFDAPSLNAIPILYRREAEMFIQLFDAQLIPNPLSSKKESHVQ